jgi:hypothetical protein
MNRLLQHFVDSSGGAQGVPPTRPPIPAPPQSSGGSYHAGNRGSYQRAAPGGPFFYQAPPTQPHSGLDEIPLTSQSTGGVYETVDLNADSSQQHRPPQYQNHHQNQHQRLFTPPAVGHRPPVGHGPPLYKTSTPPGSRDGNRSQHLYHPHAPGSTGSAAELFSSGPPPVVAGPPSSGGSSGNPYRRQAAPAHNPFTAPGSGGRFGNSTAPPKDPFAASPANSAAGMFGRSSDPFAASPTQDGGAAFGQKDPFAQENRDVIGNGTQVDAQDPFATQPPKETGYRHEQQQQQSPQPQQRQVSPTANPFASAPSHTGSSPFASPAPSNGGHQRMASADSLFSSPAPTNSGDWAQPAPSPTQSAPVNNGDWPQPTASPAQPAPPNNGDWAQPAPSPTRPASSPVQAQELFASEAPSASSLFGGSAPSPFQIQTSPTPPRPVSPPQASVPPSPAKSQVGAPPSPAKSPVNFPPSPMKPPVAAPPSPMKAPTAAPPSPMVRASSPPMRPQVTVPASPVMRPEDLATPAFGSMRLSAPAKSPLKSGLDVRHMKFPAGKRDDDAVSNAPSIAMSRMSMLSTLDDSLKLSDMYKQMTSRLEGEKHDLLKVVASQAQEIAQMKKHIRSLELQLKKSRLQDA